ncbi:caspase family protein [Bradyrhizobium elkanii]|uniref:caspase family protein n=1 Tax=Bradyrhizobium elkanii TaxID=29448 RepID=UPI0004AE6FEA|nr:caspase family protein [Bradyrhizobium elkanii]
MKRDTDAANEAISLQSVMLQVANTGSLGLVILDACRNNPFAAKMSRSLAARAAAGSGLGRIEPGGNVLVAYAARDGTTALDGDGRNSPFDAALLRNIETPGVEVTFMFRNVRDDVMEATRNAQQPFVYGSLSRKAIYLVAAPPADTTSVKQANAAPAAAASSAPSATSAGAARWCSRKPRPPS